jgi:hypothetical protein
MVASVRPGPFLLSQLSGCRRMAQSTTACMCSPLFGATLCVLRRNAEDPHGDPIFPNLRPSRVAAPTAHAAHPGSRRSDRSPSLAISSLTNTVKHFTSSPMMTLIGFFAAFVAVAKSLEGGPAGWATNMARNQPKIHVGIRIRRTWQALALAATSSEVHVSDREVRGLAPETKLDLVSATSLATVISCRE